MLLLFNYAYSVRKINSLLNVLKKYSLVSIKEQFQPVLQSSEIEELARYLAKVHRRKIMRDRLEPYNGQWVINNIENGDVIQNSNDIIKAIRIMMEIEYYQSSNSSSLQFLTWDIEHLNWANTYERGHVGSYIWDLAAILHYVSNPAFSELFLTSYIKYSGKKPSISALYANLFYIQVIDAIKMRDYGDILEVIKKICEDAIYETDIIHQDTLYKLQLVGYDISY